MTHARRLVGQRENPRKKQESGTGVVQRNSYLGSFGGFISAFAARRETL
jgi:hypothetical protein